MSWWKNEPWRLVQTNLREVDWRDMNAGQFVADLQKLNATVVMLSVGGIVANYDTKLDFQPVNPNLTGDSLDEVIKLCKSSGIRIIARMDFSKVRENIFIQHPSWVYRNTGGGVINYNGNFQTCVNGDYQREYSLETIAEVLERFPVDGLYCNMGGFQFRDYSGVYHGICHCKGCREGFMRFAGTELPQEEHGDTPTHKAYRRFQLACIKEHEARFCNFVKGINPDIALDGPDYRRIESSAAFNSPQWQFSASSNTRCVKGGDDRAVSSNADVEFIDYSSRHVAVSPALQRTRLWQNLMNLGGLDYYLIGRIDNHADKSGLSGIKKVFDFAAKNEKVLSELRPKAEILLLRNDLWERNDEERGLIKILSENHIAFAELELEKLCKKDLQRYNSIVLPDKWLNAEQAEWIDDFCRNGGMIFATGKSGICDENGEKPEAPLLDCLGIGRVQKQNSGISSAMLFVDDAERTKLACFENCSVFALGDFFAELVPSPYCETLLRFIPPHSFGPPELCKWDEITKFPGIMVNNYGLGKSVYMPWLPGALYYREGHRNTGGLLGDVICGLHGFESMVDGLPPQVEAAFGTAENKLAIFLLNHSGNIGNSFFEPLTITGLCLALHEKRTITSVRALNSDTELSFTQNCSEVIIKLPELAEFEMLLLQTEEEGQ